ncbi:hypothetical protein [Streptomyces sp. NBC_01353]|uniref:hypothetical protein n=1 Tax=Streptomyces sp. NBC_01353 TaxID=2903835 RepID=UPI002E33B9DC|nr:hypothetical protein [Streptomyces sp. NBC_01353]
MSVTVTTKRLVTRQDRAAKVQASIAAAVGCPLCPEVTAEIGLEILTKARGPEGGHWWSKASKTVQECAAELTGDPAWRERALGWIDDYRAAHGHGPSWRTFWREPSLWPAETTVSLLNTVMRQLSVGGYLDGMKTPFGLRRRAQSDS